jgi:hypothetical protein
MDDIRQNVLLTMGTETLRPALPRVRYATVAIVRMEMEK